MNIGFNLLNSRPISDKLNVDHLERQYDIILPSLYRLFVETYRIEDQIQIEQFELEGYKHSLTTFIYEPDEEVGFMEFTKNINLAFKIWEEQTQELKDIGLFPLGISGIHQGGIFVGLKDEYEEKIIIDTDYIDRFKIVSNNVFEFIRGLESVEIEKDYIYKNVDTDNLIKNWKADKWVFK